MTYLLIRWLFHDAVSTAELHSVDGDGKIFANDKLERLLKKAVEVNFKVY